MTSWVGKSIAHYRVSAQIGAGGMGEVYRASDSRLGRDVAIKVLPAEFAADQERMARFEREAKVLASLSHANIASIFGIEDAHGARALVMEMVEGPTLAERIAKGALPLDEALPIAKQIAEALEYAHERGIIHRDLKPANVKLTPDGVVKVLDFGLAKALSDDVAGSSSDLSRSPTMTAGSTKLGVILGTAAYMSPEQAKGKPVDRRADIWAFGAVLLEMLSGKPTFGGETVSEVLASVMKDEPDWSSLSAVTPPRIKDLVRRCLLKDPKQRLRDIGEARIRIEEQLSGVAEAVAPAASVKRRGIPAAAVALGALIAVAAGVVAGYKLHAPAKPPMFLATLTFPEGMRLDGDDLAFALSPDGRTVAIAASAPNEPQRLWVRRLDRAEATRLDGTDGASYPFWSPDGRSIAFFADRKLKRIPAAGGVVQSICDAIDARGGSWGRGGMIAFTPGPLDGLNIVSENGGKPEAITTLDSMGTSHRLPQFLPDGKRVLFVVGNSGAGSASIDCVDIASKKRTPVMTCESQVGYIDGGHLVFLVDGNLVAQRFDAGSLKLSGGTVPLAQGVEYNPYRYAGYFDVSSEGPLLYTPKSLSETNQPTWFDFDGRELGKLGDPYPIVMAALSHDARRLVTCDRTETFDLYVTDVLSGVRTRFTFGPDAAAFPSWSRDARTIYYGDGSGAIVARPADGASPPRTILSSPGKSLWPDQASPDGSVLVCSTQRPQTGTDLCIFPLSGKAEVRDLVTAPGNQQRPVFSPDGRWLAYQTDESGRDEVVVVRFPSLEGRWQVSSSGGETPSWLPDGRGILYSTADQHVVRVDIDGRGEGLLVGSSATIFGGKATAGPWIVAPDGKRLLVFVPTGSNATMSLCLVTDWRQLLDARSR